MRSPFDDLTYRVHEPRRAEHVAFDRERGTETSRFDLLGNYQPTRPSVVRDALGALDVAPADCTLVDLGAGKGRVLVLAAEHGFRRVVGVEWRPGLAGIARENLARTGLQADVFCGDAAEFPLPLGPLVLYAFNPFGPAVLRAVLERALSVERPVRLVYVNPFYADDVWALGMCAVAAGPPDPDQHWEIFANP